MPRLVAGVLVIALMTTACALESIEDPGIGAGGLTSSVFASDGTAITEWHAGEDRVLVSYGELPTSLVDAVVAIEDQRFWTHSGIDVQAIARAAGANLEAGEIVQGGSTITQQYVENVVLGPSRTFDGKLAEASMALRVEQTLTKEQILERYLNAIYFGNNAYGIGAAAKRYFSKHPSQLTLAESATLAAVIASPSLFDPYANPDAVLSRRRTVLEKMAELGWITEDAAEAADREALMLAPRIPGEQSRYPYFTEEVKRILMADPDFAATPDERFDLLFRGGLRIYTTIDPSVQLAAETALASVIPQDGPSGALVAIDPRNGRVVALVGGKDFYDTNDPVAQFDLATMGRRQPGSSFKPFLLAAALEAGYRLDDLFEGGSETIVPGENGPWTVTNYEQATYPDLTLREATVFSVNTVYADLITALGPNLVVDLARAAGITSPLDPLPSLALGSQDVSVLEMASAYGTFATGGIHVEPVFITRVEDTNGNLIYEPVPTVTDAMPASVADRVTSVLTEAVRRGTGQQAKIGRPTAGKTGTTEAHHDAWFVGYTEELVAAVWIGFPEGNRPLMAPYTPYTITGGTWPAQVWSRFAIGALSGVPYGGLATGADDGLASVEIDTSTGFLAGPLCPRSRVATLHLDPDAVPTVVCPIHNHDGITSVAPGVVPDVGGAGVDEAVALLEAAGFGIRLSWADAPGRRAGEVLFQVPAAGTTLAGGSDVALTLTGPEPGSEVPDVLGLTVAEARSVLHDAGLVAVVRLESESDPEAATARIDRVWAQQPSAGSDPDGSVTIWANPADPRT
ncbi:MAG: PBP1A family penicillin-binding protein [Actinobacteria bacterium]|nr:PBP1A family penicillin-binding protein [Actinomycetota bacterium]